MKLVKGKDLTQKQREEVFSRYVYRHLAIGEGKYYKSDNAWLVDHAFHVKNDGDLGNKHKFCEPHYLAD